jgi:hypothetical protein
MPNVLQQSGIASVYSAILWRNTRRELLSMRKLIAAAALALFPFGAIAQTAPNEGAMVPNAGQSAGGGSSTLSVGSTGVTGGTPNNCLVNSATLSDKACPGLGSNTFTGAQILPNGTLGIGGASIQFGNSNFGLYSRNSGSTLSYEGNSVDLFELNNVSAALKSTYFLGWSSSTPDQAGTDSSVGRLAAGLLGVGNGTASDFSGGIKLSYTTKNGGVTAVGTTGTCTASSITPGTSGTFSAAVCTATNTFILSGLTAQPTGYNCDATDRTTSTAKLRQTASTTTSVTFTVDVATVASDVIGWKCDGY